MVISGSSLPCYDPRGGVRRGQRSCSVHPLPPGVATEVAPGQGQAAEPLTEQVLVSQQTDSPGAVNFQLPGSK